MVNGTELRAHKSKDVRDACANTIHTMLICWPPSFIEKDIDALQSGIKKCLEDSSAETRAAARSTYVVFKKNWPHRAISISQAVDARTARMLSMESTAPSSVGNTSPSSTVTVGTRPTESLTNCTAALAIQALYRSHVTRRNSFSRSASDFSGKQALRLQRRICARLRLYLISNKPKRLPIAWDQRSGSRPKGATRLAIKRNFKLCMK